MTATRSFPTGDSLSITDTRRVIGGLVVKNTDGTPRAGVFPAHTNPLVTGLSSMAYSVGVFVAATVRIAGGCELVANDAAVTVSTTAAPAANRRIDVIWIRSRFTQHSDGSNLAEIGVTQGAAAASPVKPSIPAGALELATAEILSTTTTTATAVITQSAPFTATAGGVVPFRNLTQLQAWTNAGSQQKAVDLSSGVEYVWNGTRWVTPDGTLIPSSLTGATVDEYGFIIPTSGQSLIRINGIFTPRFRVYRFIFSLAFSTSSSGVNLNLTTGGTPYTGSTHNIQRLTSSAGSTASLPLTNLGVWSGSGVTGSNLSGEWIVRNPASAGIKWYAAEAMVAPGTTAFSRENGWLGNVDANIFDGIQLSATGGTFAGGFVKVQPVG